MKRILLLVMLLGPLTAIAQPKTGYVNGDVDLGYAWPTEGFGVKPGVAFLLEPHYYLSPNFTVGLRLEGEFLGYQSQYNDEVFSFFGSTCLTGELRAPGKFRPFIGGGAGLFTRHYVFDNPDYGIDGDERLFISGYGTIKAGAFVRTGFEAGHLRFTATYNVITSNFSYVSVTIGYIID